MRTELVHPTDRPTQFLQRLDDKEFCIKLITTNGDKDALLEGLKRNIFDFTSLEKISLLKGVLNYLSDEGEESWRQNRRDAGLEVLRLVDLTSLTPQELTNISLQYIRTVYAVNEALNPNLYGEIDALLEAGKIIAPAMSRDSYGMHVAKGWRTVASRFTEPEQTYILCKSREIQGRMPKSNKPPSDLEQEVTELANQGLSNKEIAAKLKVKTKKVYELIKRLSNNGTVFVDRPPGRRQTEQNRQLSDTIKTLRLEGMGNTLIARSQNIPINKVTSLGRRLVQKGEIPAIYKPRKKV